MTLKDLIKFLEQQDPSLIVPVGFTHPHSYRGYYYDLAFEPEENVTVGQMLGAAKGAMGKTFTGYKGGEFTMGDYTDCWLATYGDCGEGIGPVLLKYMMDAAKKPEKAAKRGRRSDGR